MQLHGNITPAPAPFILLRGGLCFLIFSLCTAHEREEEEEPSQRQRKKGNEGRKSGKRRVSACGGGDTELMNLKDTELCLGLPGGCGGEAGALNKAAGSKRGYSETVDLELNLIHDSKDDEHLNMEKRKTVSRDDHGVGDAISKEKNSYPAKPPEKAQVVGWPPVRSYRKNAMASQKASGGSEAKAATTAAFVKVSMDGAPYLRKVDLNMYKSYQELSSALAKMFSSFTMGNYDDAQGMIDFMNESKLMDLLNSSEYVPSYEDRDGDWMLVGDVPWVMFVQSCKRLRIMKGSEAIGLAPRAVEKCRSRA